MFQTVDPEKVAFVFQAKKIYDKQQAVARGTPELPVRHTRTNVSGHDCFVQDMTLRLRWRLVGH